jgi:hypothetical protein
MEAPSILGPGALAPVLETFSRKVDFRRGSLPRPLLEHRKREQDLAVLALTGKQEPEAARRCVRADFVDFVAQVPRGVRSTLLYVTHSGCDSRDFLVGKLRQKRPHRTSTAWCSVVAPVPMVSLRHAPESKIAAWSDEQWRSSRAAGKVRRNGATRSSRDKREPRNREPRNFEFTRPPGSSAVWRAEPLPPSSRPRTSGRWPVPRPGSRTRCRARAPSRSSWSRS